MIAFTLALALLLWLTVTLAEVGALSAAVLIGAAAVATAAVAAVAWRRGALRRAGGGKWLDARLAIVALLVAAGAWLYTPPFEQVAGGRDPVTYVLTGISIAEHGNFVLHDEIVPQIPAADRTDLLGADHRPQRAHYGPRFPGWYLIDPDSGEVVPQGLPLYPAVIAVGYLGGGMPGALRVTALLAIAAAVALFFLGQRLFGGGAAATAAILFLVSPAQVWFSRYANAEAIAQVLVIVGLWAFVIYRRSRSRPHALLSAVALGLCWQAHVWTAWLVFPLLGVLVFDLLRGRVGRRDLAFFWLPLLVLGVHALLVGAVVWAYLFDVLRVLRGSLSVLYPLAAALVLGLLACWYWGWRRPSSDEGGRGEGATRRLGWVRPTVAAAVVGLAAYGYWIRPGLIDVELDWRVESVLRLVAATTPAAFWLAIAGIVLLLLDRRFDEPSMLVLAIVLATSIPVLYNPTISRDMMWALRRYQTICPFVFLFAAAMLWWPAQRARQRHGPGAELGWSVAAAVAGALLIGSVASIGIRYRGIQEPGDALAMVDEVTASLEDDAVLVFEARSDWGVRDIAPALEYWKGFDVVLLSSKRLADDEALLDLVRRQAQRGRPVYFFTQGFNYYFAQPRLVPHREWTFRRREMELGYGRLPTEMLVNEIRFNSYRLEAGGSNGPLDGGLDVGEWDDVFVGEALPRETSGEYTARWTKATSFFWLPGLAAGTAEIVVHAATFVDGEQYPRTLRARLDGIDLGEIPLDADWRDYVFAVPSDWQPPPQGAPRLELSTEAIQPDRVHHNGDMRYLGILVNAIIWH